MADHIPFVYNEKDCQLVERFYRDCAILRLSLDSIDKTLGAIPKGPGIWLDPAIDGLHDLPKAQDPWKSFVKSFVDADAIGDPDFQEKPEKVRVKRFVAAVLNECLKKVNTARWLSVPQLPVVNGPSRNKINRQLAEGTREWKQESKFRAKLILPVILRHQEQVKLKTRRRPHVALASKCYKDADADGVWIVESSLSDQDGSKTFEQPRFPGLLSFHDELSELLPKDSITVAG